MKRPLITEYDIAELAYALSTRSMGDKRDKAQVLQNKRRAIMRLYYRISGRLFDKRPKISVREAVKRMAEQ